MERYLVPTIFIFIITFLFLILAVLIRLLLAQMATQNPNTRFQHEKLIRFSRLSIRSTSWSSSIYSGDNIVMTSQSNDTLCVPVWSLVQDTYYIQIFCLKNIKQYDCPPSESISRLWWKCPSMSCVVIWKCLKLTLRYFNWCLFLFSFLNLLYFRINVNF